MVDDWRTWVPEPWDFTQNGTLHHRGNYIGEVDLPDKERPGYASDGDVATAERIAACVNALAGVRHPEALPEALDALGGGPGLLSRLGALSADAELRAELRAWAVRAEAALRALGRNCSEEQ